jgi:hypothetical protein
MIKIEHTKIVTKVLRVIVMMMMIKMVIVLVKHKKTVGQWSKVGNKWRLREVAHSTVEGERESFGRQTIKGPRRAE